MRWNGTRRAASASSDRSDNDYLDLNWPHAVENRADRAVGGERRGLRVAFQRPAADHQMHVAEGAAGRDLVDIRLHAGIGDHPHLGGIEDRKSTRLNSSH